MTDMESDQEKRNVRPIVAGLLVLLPVLYVAGIGPAAYLVGRQIIDPGTYFSVYAPLYSFPPLAELLVQYTDWWARLAH